MYAVSRSNIASAFVSTDWPTMSSERRKSPPCYPHPTKEMASEMKTLKSFYTITDKGRKANPTAKANRESWAKLRPLLIPGNPVAGSHLVAACRRHDHPRGAEAFVIYIADDLGWLVPN